MFRVSSVAEQAAVNRKAGGSNPSLGANLFCHDRDNRVGRSAAPKDHARNTHSHHEVTKVV
jgi:hypothetical protein